MQCFSIYQWGRELPLLDLSKALYFYSQVQFSATWAMEEHYSHNDDSPQTCGIKLIVMAQSIPPHPRTPAPP